MMYIMVLTDYIHEQVLRVCTETARYKARLRLQVQNSLSRIVASRIEWRNIYTLDIV